MTNTHYYCTPDDTSTARTQSIAAHACFVLGAQTSGPSFNSQPDTGKHHNLLHLRTDDGFSTQALTDILLPLDIIRDLLRVYWYTP